jgi:glyoxylase-like metal-dependent hydrolase (beta-lactamase superfamily II)
MKNYICITCGAQYASSAEPPSECKICEDERQYVGWDGQQWTTLEEMWQEKYHNVNRQIEPSLFGIGTEPRFGIGQRSLLIKTEHGNVLWDPISYLDSQTIQQIHAHGGIQAISVSHPHFYSSMIEWSHAFDHAPIYLPQADRDWIIRPDGVISFFKNEIEIFPGIAVVRCGGHFPGSSVLHWSNGADGKGALLAGDTIMVAMDRKSVSFMYSFPNLIPVSAEKVRQVVGAVKALTFDRIYSAWWDRIIPANAKTFLDASAMRYIEALSDYVRS